MYGIPIYKGNRATVRELQEVTRHHMQEVFSPQGARLVFPESTILSLRYFKNTNDKKNGQKVKEFTEVYAGFLLIAPLPIAFCYHLFEALRRHPEKLRHCVACRNPFFAIKRHREYCSDQCRARTNARFKRNIPPERFGKCGRRTSPVLDKGKGAANKVLSPKKGASHGKKR